MRLLSSLLFTESGLLQLLLAGVSGNKRNPKTTTNEKSITKPHRSQPSNSITFLSFPEKGGTSKEQKLNLPVYHLKLENKEPQLSRRVLSCFFTPHTNNQGEISPKCTD